MNNKTTTREGMLKECIEYAVKNGFKSDKLDVQAILESIEIDLLPDMVEGYVTEDVKISLPNPEKSVVRIDPLYFVNVLLFDHDFCKAIYGDKDEDGDLVTIGCGSEFYHWQYRLMQQSIADDPLLYMFNYIK